MNVAADIGEASVAVSAAAFSLAVSAGKAVKAVKTTPLLTIEDGVAAMQKAAGAGYRPPGG